MDTSVDKKRKFNPGGDEELNSKRKKSKTSKNERGSHKGSDVDEASCGDASQPASTKVTEDVVAEELDGTVFLPDPGPQHLFEVLGLSEKTMKRHQRDGLHNDDRHTKRCKSLAKVVFINLGPVGYSAIASW